MDLIEVAGLTVLYGLISPFVAVPGALIGWFARRWWHVFAGAAAITLVGWISFFLVTRPEGARVVHGLMPVGLIAPTIWASSVFKLRRWLRGSGGGEIAQAGGARRVAWTILGALAGGVAGTAIALGLGMAFVALARVSNVEGAAGYLVVFGFGVPGLLIGLVVGLVVTLMLTRAPAGGSGPPTGS